MFIICLDYLLQAILNNTWRYHFIKAAVILITKTIQVKRTRHYWGSTDKLASDIFLWTPSNGRAKARRPARTIQQLCADIGFSQEYIPRAMDDRDGEIQTGSATSWWWWVRIYIYMCVCVCFPSEMLVNDQKSNFSVSWNRYNLGYKPQFILYIYIIIYIYIYMCVCVCARARARARTHAHNYFLFNSYPEKLLILE